MTVWRAKTPPTHQQYIWATFRCTKSDINQMWPLTSGVTSISNSRQPLRHRRSIFNQVTRCGPDSHCIVILRWRCRTFDLYVHSRKCRVDGRRASRGPWNCSHCVVHHIFCRVDIVSVQWLHLEKYFFNTVSQNKTCSFHNSYLSIISIIMVLNLYSMDYFETNEE